MNQNQPLENLNSRVKSIWQRSQNLHVTAGLLSFCRWGIMLFVAGMLLDWLVDFPAPARIALLVVILAVAIYQAWCSGWRNVRRFNAAEAARQIEEHHGDFESILVTAIQFRESKMAPGSSQSLQEITCLRAEEAVAAVEPEKVVHYQALRRPLTIALALALLIAAFGAFNGPFLGTGIARIFPPWTSTDYPTRTQLKVDSRKLIVQEGAPAVITAHVSGVIPSEAEFELRTGKGEPRIHELAITNGKCEYTIKAAYRGFEYRVLAGDAKSPWQEVEVISAPRIKQAELNLEYPAYTKRPAETVEALTVTVPEGTNIQWKLSLDRAVNQATYTPAGGEAKPLEISEDGLTVTISKPATESRAYSFSWVEKEHGFSFTSPNHYLQVAPDQQPIVELTSPKKNLYATLGRKVDFAFRGRDDHGIGQAKIGFSVNKLEEQKIPFNVNNNSDGAAQDIQWDYRSALPDLAIGDTVSVVVELTDLYPGADGPHLARSQARRITILSERDYLRQIYKQQQRLLTKLRSLYREERKVHTTVTKLNPSAPEFIQTCQLEAVRQDLMRERITALRTGFQELIDDLAANNIQRESVTTLLSKLHADLEKISEHHVAQAAAQLRALASAARNKPKNAKIDTASASFTVDSAARELGCLVLQIGFREATEVMARELHAIAENQAAIRLQTILLDPSAESANESLAQSQQELAIWIDRLFSSLPKDKETTIEDALVAFNLSRLVKTLRQSGVDTKMQQAATLTSKPKSAGSNEAAKLQADVIKSLLYAEFRLRIGAEHEALDNAAILFASQVTEQKKLRDAISALTPEKFNQDRSKLAKSQAALQQQLQLLLMPDIAAPRSQMLDTTLPPKPPVEELLANAENALQKAVAHINAGERDQAIAAQQQSEKSFDALSEVIRLRSAALTERAQLSNLSLSISNSSAKITAFEERQLSLIEKTEDAENESQAVQIATLQQKLAQDIGKFQLILENANKKLQNPNNGNLPLMSHLEQLEGSMNKAAKALKANEIDESIELQELGLTTLENATKLLARQALQNSSLSLNLNDTWTAMIPAPYVGEIEAEQLDLVTATTKAKESDLPQLAVVQKNLIHAVNAVLTALDPLAHQIESGSVFVFAKDDMDAAATAIEENDMEEAADAGSFVAESLQKLSNELAIVTPRYSYMLQINEFYNQVVAENTLIHMQQSQLIDKANSAKDAAALSALVDAQLALQARANSYAKLMLTATGQPSYRASAEAMSAVLNELKSGNKDAIVTQMQSVESILDAENQQMVNLMELIANVLKPSPTPEVTQESLIVLDILSLASDQKVLQRKTQSNQTKPAKDITDQQRALAKRSEMLTKRVQAFGVGHIPAATTTLIAGFQSNRNGPTPQEIEKIVSAEQTRLKQFFATNQSHIEQANKLIAVAAAKLQSGAAKEAIDNQNQAGEMLRFCLIAYINELLSPPGPPSASDPVVTDPTEPSLEDDMIMYMPGAVSGTKPKGGRQEWEVLGKRDRAALNENFARELPLEYRAVLKDYYERLAK